MKKMLNLFVCLLLCFSSSAVFAQKLTGRANVEALENINVSLERIENAITALTSQSEENAYNQKHSKAESDLVLKDMKLQISEIKTEQEKLVKDFYAQKVEMQNLNNIVAMSKEKLEELEQKYSELSKKYSELEKEFSERATNNPVNLLLVENNEKNEKKSDEKVKKNSDEESFNLALKDFEGKDFTESAIKFASNLKEFPEGKFFHKNLLYLGLSMKELDNKNGACTAFAKIVNSKEKIDADVKDKAKSEFESVKCNPKESEEVKENNANK